LNKAVGGGGSVVAKGSGAHQLPAAGKKGKQEMKQGLPQAPGRPFLGAGSSSKATTSS
ncbi:unnamed protein product, partial [Amoebophrya sp. A25]